MIYIDIKQLRPLWRDVEHDAVDGSGQSNASNQKRDQNDVGKDGGEVCNLSRTEIKSNFYKLDFNVSKSFHLQMFH